MLPFPAASRRALRLALAASSGTPLALRATACSAPLSPPERTRRAARHVTPHHIASELLDRNSLRMDLLVRIDQRNPCTLFGVARRRVSRQGYPCTAPPLGIGSPVSLYQKVPGGRHRSAAVEVHFVIENSQLLRKYSRIFGPTYCSCDVGHTT